MKLGHLSHRLTCKVQRKARLEHTIHSCGTGKIVSYYNNALAPRSRRMLRVHGVWTAKVAHVRRVHALLMREITNRVMVEHDYHERVEDFGWKDGSHRYTPREMYQASKVRGLVDIREKKWNPERVANVLDARRRFRRRYRRSSGIIINDGTPNIFPVIGS